MLREILIKSALIVFSALSLQGCFTGVEGTKKINLSHVEEKILSGSKESLFMNSISPYPLNKWYRGKRFLIVDNRISLLFDARSLTKANLDSTILAGKQISFHDVDSTFSPMGIALTVLLFEYRDSISGDTHILRYPLSYTSKQAEYSVNSSTIPLLIDLDMIDDARRILSGLTLYTRTPVWYDANLQKITGLKYIPVTISDVTAGTMVFPLKLKFNTADNKTGFILMNYGNSPAESRSFETLFYLDDVKKQYPRISEKNWESICNSQVEKGMTKEECRLALGNPADVDTGHNWSQTLDIWKYPNGSYLRFADGILIDFRK